jgi:hypothetical protein
MKSGSFVLSLLLGLTAATFGQGGRGTGGPQTAPPSSIGGGTTAGTTPEGPTRGWAAFMMRIHADGFASPAERREVVRYLSRAPLHLRSQLLLSWFSLKTQIGGNTHPAVVNGIVAQWTLTDPGAAAAWVNSLPGRDR